MQNRDKRKLLDGGNPSEARTLPHPTTRERVGKRRKHSKHPPASLSAQQKRLTGHAALLVGAEVVRAQGSAGVRDGDVAVGAGVVRAEGLAAQLGGAALRRAQDFVGVQDGGKAAGAGVERAERLAALRHLARVARARDLPGVGDGDETSGAVDGVAESLLRIRVVGGRGQASTGGSGGEGGA